MALTQSKAQIRTNVRKFSDTQGTTALLRHPNDDIDDYINRALGSLHRRLTTALPDQRYLSSQTVTTVAGMLTYPLASDFDHLISVDITADGRRTWLEAFEMNERPELLSADTSFTGVPFAYRLRGANIEYLPTVSGVYSSVLWYVPTPTQPAVGSGGDATTFDTISRLDDYLIAYASKPIAIKDKNWDLLTACKSVIADLEGEIDVIARGRDKNSPPRITDVYQSNRWGRRMRRAY